jgi:glutathione S-transferase
MHTDLDPDNSPPPPPQLMQPAPFCKYFLRLCTRACSLKQNSFIAFAGIMKNKDSAEHEGLLEKLHTKLADMEAILAVKTSKFLLDDELSAEDCKLAPFLWHLLHALPHYHGTDALASYPKMRDYLDRVAQTPEFQATAYPADTVVWGWSKFFK